MEKKKNIDFATAVYCRAPMWIMSLNFMYFDMRPELQIDELRKTLGREDGLPQIPSSTLAFGRAENLGALVISSP